MILVEQLRLIMKNKGYDQKKLAAAIGVAENTLSRKLKKGVLGSDEIMRISELLEIEHPEQIFLVKEERK